MVVSNYEASALMMPQQRSRRLRGFGNEDQTLVYYSPDQWNAQAQPVSDPTTQPTSGGSDWTSVIAAGLGVIGKVTDTIGRFAQGGRATVPPGVAGYRPPGASFNAVPWIVGGVAVLGIGATVMLLKR